MKKLVGYLIEPHVQDCYYFRKGFVRNRPPWVLPESTGVTPPGHKTRKHLYVFRCNNHGCTAKLGISSSQFHQVWEELLAHYTDKGAPKKSQGGTR